MARGEIESYLAALEDRQRRHGEGSATVGPQGDVDSPLNRDELELLDDVLIEAERVTGLRFTAYLGDLGDDTRAAAEGLLTSLGAEAPVAVLLAVSPGQRVVEVVTGGEASRRISERAARLAVMTVTAACGLGEIANGLVNGLRILADQAGTLPDRTTW
ncbi:MAG: DUF5130 family protein [Nakamurella sp.]